MHLECWPPAVISFSLCLSFTQITRPPFLHPFMCIPPSPVSPHKTQSKHREKSLGESHRNYRDWPLPSYHTKQYISHTVMTYSLYSKCICMTYIRNVYVWIHPNESALNDCTENTSEKDWHAQCSDPHLYIGWDFFRDSSRLKDRGYRSKDVQPCSWNSSSNQIHLN